MFFPDQEREVVARGLVIPDNRAIKNLKGRAEAKSKSEREKRDSCWPFTFLRHSLSCVRIKRRGKVLPFQYEHKCHLFQDFVVVSREYAAWCRTQLRRCIKIPRCNALVAFKAFFSIECWCNTATREYILALLNSHAAFCKQVQLQPAGNSN